MGDTNTLKEIELAIERLTTQEFEDLRRWFDQYDRPQPIDLQLEADLESGKLDDRISRAVSDHKSSRTRPL